jgi:hypothetical protein
MSAARSKKADRNVADDEEHPAFEAAIYSAEPASSAIQGAAA